MRPSFPTPTIGTVGMPETDSIGTILSVRNPPLIYTCTYHSFYTSFGCCSVRNHNGKRGTQTSDYIRQRHANYTKTDICSINGNCTVGSVEVCGEKVLRDLSSRCCKSKLVRVEKSMFCQTWSRCLHSARRSEPQREASPIHPVPGYQP